MREEKGGRQVMKKEGGRRRKWGEGGRMRVERLGRWEYGGGMGRDEGEAMRKKGEWMRVEGGDRRKERW